MPTPAGFLTFIRTQMQISTTALPDASPDILAAYNLSIATVNLTFAAIACPPGLTTVYDLMAYNLGGDNLINYATDTPPSTYFADLRAKLHINSFVAGVISESHDETTGQSIAVPESLTQLSLSDLANLKTPYGRAYLQFAQKYGPSNWGLS